MTLVTSNARPKRSPRPRVPVGALAAASALAVIAMMPAAASAEYFFTERGAGKATKDFAHKRYGVNRSAAGVACRPQGQRQADSRYKYHRWTCTWADGGFGCGSGNLAFGTVLIVGQSGKGAYGYKVLRGSHCDSA